MMWQWKWAFSAVALMVGALVMVTGLLLPYKEPVAKQNDLYLKEKREGFSTDPMSFIAHGGGGIDGYAYTNSLDAVESSIRNGFRLIELDLLETSDGYLVGGHDWRHVKKMAGFQGDDIDDMPLSLDDFRRLRFYGKYRPITEFEIRDIFLGNPNLYLVVDKNNNFEVLAKKLGFGDRLLVEVFGHQPYLEARLVAGLVPMLSIEDWKKDLPFINKNNVRYVVMHSQVMDRNIEGVRSIIDRGVVVFVYSANDGDYIKRNIGVSATAFYTDYWDLKRGGCGNNVCKVY